MGEVKIIVKAYHEDEVNQYRRLLTTNNSSFKEMKNGDSIIFKLIKSDDKLH